jgi:hypothetical protein
MARISGKVGNQNSRRHGWTSRQRPTPTAEILTAVDVAMGRILPGAADDTLREAFATLRHAERALRFRCEGDMARMVREAADLARYRLTQTPPAASTHFALDAPESVETPAREHPAQMIQDPTAGVAQAEPAMPSRIAIGHRPSCGQEIFPDSLADDTLLSRGPPASV